MMRRPLPSCQICGLINRQQAAHYAKRPFVTLDAGRRLAKLSPARPSSPIQSRLFSASPLCLKLKRTSGAQSLNDTFQSRFAKSSQAASGSVEQEANSDGGLLRQQQQQQQQQRERQLDPADIASLAAAVDRVAETFLAQNGIPSEHMTLTALQACRQAAGKLPLDLSPAPATSSQAQSQNAAFNLLDLDGNGRKAADGSGMNPTPQQRALDLAYQISDAAYAIISHPPVVITPQLLHEYVALQSRLGRPETLPQVLDLFASKPTPELVSGSLHYAGRNPHRIRNAVSTTVAEAAMDAAIEAKHLDAAIGVIEGTYGTKAFKRSKLVTKALLPASLVAAAPVGIYILATHLASLQDSYDQATATRIAFIGCISYFGFTGTIGLVALATANDQMNRVTWAEGIPLSERWMREEERAAYDKVACSFGFSDELKAGEEEGDEFLVFREFLLRKGLILDKVDLMPGMN